MCILNSRIINKPIYQIALKLMTTVIKPLELLFWFFVLTACVIENILRCFLHGLIIGLIKVVATDLVAFLTSVLHKYMK